MKSDPIGIRGSLEKSWMEGAEEAKLLFRERPPPVIIIFVVIIITIVITMMLVALSRISCNQDDLSSKP